MRRDQLLEVLKVATWQQAVFGVQAAKDIQRALRLDNTAPPPIHTGKGVNALTPPSGSGPGGAAFPSRSVRRPSFDRRVYGVWANTQVLVVSAGNVSKLLWPGDRGHSHECDLRTLLGVALPSPLEDRSLRNAFEHFDERIVKRAKMSEPQHYSDTEIYGSRAEAPNPLPIRAFLADEFAVVMLDKIYLLRPIVAALAGVADLANPSLGRHL